MNTQDFSTSLQFKQSPETVFNAINNVSAWWSTDFEGSAADLHDTFTVRFGEVYITSDVVESDPCKKIVWLVTDCNKHWLKNPKEWVGTKMCWELSEADGGTKLHFTHFGLNPEIECYGVCSNAWGPYIHKSLVSLLETGKGQPTQHK